MSTIDEFEPHVGKIVHFSLPGEPAAIQAFPLDRIITYARSPPPGVRQPFTLIFRGPREPAHMAEGLYDCAFEDGPTFLLHVTPIHTPDPGWQEYQAAFN